MARAAAGRNGCTSAPLSTEGAGENAISRLFSDIAQVTAREAGRAWVFALAVVVILVWAVTGPLFGFSDTWQLVINTGTTIITFLMVFLIQNSQNRDGAAIQVKLNELIRASKAHNSFIGVEHLTDEQIQNIRSAGEDRAKGVSSRHESAKRKNGDAIAS